MQLQATTDYGVRVMCCLYAQETLITATELSEQLYISYPYLMKVLGQLRQSGMIEVVRGRFGGYRMAEGSQNITLYDIIKTMEGEILVNSCMSKNGVCTRNAIDTCPVHKVFESVQKQLICSFENVKLSDIADLIQQKNIVTAEVNQTECMSLADMYNHM